MFVYVSHDTVHGKDRAMFSVTFIYHITNATLATGAANKAYENKLISKEALQRVAVKALSELAEAEKATATTGQFLW